MSRVGNGWNSPMSAQVATGARCWWGDVWKLVCSSRPLTNYRRAVGWLDCLPFKELGPTERASLLAGRPGGGQRDGGRIVCACFGVGLNTLTAAIREQGLTTPEAIGATLKAGTNCGSCVPELRQLIAQG